MAAYTDWPYPEAILWSLAIGLGYADNPEPYSHEEKQRLLELLNGTLLETMLRTGACTITSTGCLGEKITFPENKTSLAIQSTPNIFFEWVSDAKSCLRCLSSAGLRCIKL